MQKPGILTCKKQIAVKVERFLKEIPKFMIKQSNKHDFPIIFIPDHYSLAEVIQNSLDVILNAQKNFLTRTLNIHQTLTNEMMGGVDEFADELGNIIDNPIILVDSAFNILSNNLTELDSSNFLNTIDDQFIYNLKNEKIRKYIEKKVTINKRKLTQIKIPIVYSNYVYGYIITWEYNRSLNKLDINTLNWASTIAAFHILNQKEIFKVNMKYKNEFLYDILKGRLNNKDIIIDRGEKLSWNLRNHFQVVLIDLKKLIDKSYLNKRRIIYDHIYRLALNSSQIFKNKEVIIGEIGSNIIILYPADFLENKRDQAEKMRLNQYLNNIKERLKKDDWEKIKIGVGEIQKDILDLPKSYKQAKKSLQVANNLNNKNKNIYFFNQLGIYKLLYNISETDITEFLDNHISQLVKYDKENNTELVETLHSYFENNTNLSETARTMYIHYNTALYRIEKIEEITGSELKNSEDRLNLEIAVKLLQSKKADKKNKS